MANNPHRPKLIFVGEPFDGRICALELETTTVGRSSANHLSIQDPSVSARHCEILVHDSEVIVRDLLSANGTFINAVRIKGQAQLKHGQTLRFGNVNARLELAAPDADRSTADATAVYQHAKFTREARAERENPKPPPQPVTIDGGTGRLDEAHTVSLRKEQVENSNASPAKLPEPAAIKPAPNKWLILVALLALAAVLWWLLRR